MSGPADDEVSDAAVPALHCFEFTVSDPERVAEGGLAVPYWSYLVTTRTDLPQLRCAGQEVAEYAVRRRFRDFAWLRGQLLARHPGCLVPPTPQKSLRAVLEAFTGRGDASVAHRTRALRKFLVRVGAHDQLHRDELLHAFLTLACGPLHALIEATPPAPAPLGASPSLAARVLHYVPFAAAQAGGGGGGGGGVVVGGGVGGAAPASASAKILTEAEQEELAHWTEADAYVGALEVVLEKVRGGFDTLADARKAGRGALGGFGRATMQTAAVEKKAGHAGAAAALQAIGQGAGETGVLVAELAAAEHDQIAETLLYYVAMCAAVKEQIARVKAAVHAAAQQRDALARLSARGDAMPDGAKKVALYVETDTLKEEVEASAQAVGALSATLRSEFTRFQKEKAYDLKQVLSTWVGLQQSNGKKQVRLFSRRR
eukprot:Rhum_TRINITY_DN8385_c0_g1::Rhum_TRINITY_DN8385_c0_g1_i1::g.27548::m.27548/K17917/SNX1_2; sorting nexin-1/2